MAIDLDREYFFSDVKLVCTIFSPIFCFFFFYELYDTLGARSKIGYNDIGYFAIDFPIIWWIA